MAKDVKRILGIVFDADNTLYDTRKVARSADLAALKVASRLAKSDADDLYRIWSGIVKAVKRSKDPETRSRRHSYAMLLKELGIKDRKVLDAMYDSFVKVLVGKMRLNPGTREVLKRLKREFGLFVVSEDRKSLLDKKLGKLGIKGYFNLVISSDDVNIMKPSRKYYALLRKKTGMDYDMFAIVGDSFERDLEIPKRLGMTTFLLGGGKKGGADYGIKSIKGLAIKLNLR